MQILPGQTPLFSQSFSPIQPAPNLLQSPYKNHHNSKQIEIPIDIVTTTNIASKETLLPWTLAPTNWIRKENAIENLAANEKLMDLAMEQLQVGLVIFKDKISGKFSPRKMGFRGLKICPWGFSGMGYRYVKESDTRILRYKNPDGERERQKGETADNERTTKKTKKLTQLRALLFRSYYKRWAVQLTHSHLFNTWPKKFELPK